MTTHDRLVQSARELLWDRGYVGTSPKAIQQRAGAGQGSMYHHFTGKPDLALTAVRESGDQLRQAADAALSGPGTVVERISAYLLRQREVLRGCPMGRLTQDPDIVASPTLRGPVADVFRWLQARMSELLVEGQNTGELNADLVPEDIAATLVAVVQGGYVLARADASVEPFERAVRGALALLSSQAI